jgi:putative xylitol transport system substrate-binding protein
MALGAIEAIKAAGLKVGDFAIAGVDGVTDAINAVKAGEMASILQDANAQAQGALDVAIKAAEKNKDYQPESAIWKQYPSMPWAEGAQKDYLVPWTPVTSDNADQLLESRK